MVSPSDRHLGLNTTKTPTIHNPLYPIFKHFLLRRLDTEHAIKCKAICFGAFGEFLRLQLDRGIGIINADDCLLACRLPLYAVERPEATDDLYVGGRHV